MKQISQSLKTGATEVIDVPAPALGAGQLLIRSRRSLISAGTERMLVSFGRANLLDKARQQPERVKQVFEKARTDGVVAPVEAVRSKLDQPFALGYCNAGVVIGVGPGVEGFAVGDRVVSNGPHAEVVVVGKNLCAKVPEGISDEAASFAVLGSIGLQGIRLAAPTLGECFVVTGLGLIGLVAVQLLRANGCRVLGIDTDSSRVALAQRFGAETVDLSRGEDPLSKAEAFSEGRGVDGVIVTASTKESTPISQAAQMCRKHGRIVLVGVTGLELDRTTFYHKELSFQVSCSYGPGRYDPAYEDKGQDYPIGFVRWTEQRNFEAILQLLGSGTLDVAPLISHRYPIGEGSAAYELIAEGGKASLGVVLEYAAQEAGATESAQRVVSLGQRATEAIDRPRLAVIGAGNFAGMVLLPGLAQTGAELATLASARGFSAATLGRKFGFAQATTDVSAVMGDPKVDAVVIATRHDNHAELVCRALEAGKHVFVEKPLAIDQPGLDAVIAAYQARLDSGNPAIVMVGFNRRFAPHVARMKEALGATAGPKAMVMTVNAGAIPREHWVHDRTIGGGRIIGEGCHFIDLLRFLAGAPIVSISVEAARNNERVVDDIVSFTLRFGDGSLGTVHYLASGHKSFPKERLEVFADGRVMQLDNFRSLSGYGWPGLRSGRGLRQDKGHQAELAAFVWSLRSGGPAPIPFEQLVEVTEASFELQRRFSCGSEQPAEPARTAAGEGDSPQGRAPAVAGQDETPVAGATSKSRWAAAPAAFVKHGD